MNIAKLVEMLLFEFQHNIRDGIYGYTQRQLAYNSNKIEGSTLTPEQTETLFETGELVADGIQVYRAKDIEEMRGHFMMFNYMLNTLKEPLSESLIKAFHKELKQGVFEDRANGYAIGDYKKRPNIIGNVTTTSPDQVQQEINELLSWYNSLSNITLEDISAFHVKFERIHPFQDGNGRVGRIIMFRECLRNCITPFIVQDVNRSVYITNLQIKDSDECITAMMSYFESEQQAYSASAENLLEGSVPSYKQRVYTVLRECYGVSDSVKLELVFSSLPKAAETSNDVLRYSIENILKNM